VHAGLETAVIGDKVAGLDMISFGPQIEAPHSPDERVSIPTVDRFWKLLVGGGGLKDWPAVLPILRACTNSGQIRSRSPMGERARPGPRREKST